nr:hypothetical protein GCM10017745_37200 [Saccharothrix mutabilis subsp. capreolus]
MFILKDLSNSAFIFRIIGAAAVPHRDCGALRLRDLDRGRARRTSGHLARHFRRALGVPQDTYRRVTIAAVTARSGCPRTGSA